MFVLLAAILPNLLYVGHGPTEPVHAHETEGARESTERGGEHVQHCHVGPSKCAGQPSLVGMWWVGDAPLLPEPDLFLATVGSAEINPIDPPSVRLLRPPQATV
jgi:hypothetical protein